MDLRIVHDRWGSISDPSINGHLHYPNDMDRSLDETTTDKIRKYHADYEKTIQPLVSHLCLLLLVRPGGLQARGVLLVG